MNNYIKHVLLFLLLTVTGTSCSLDQSAIDQAVQQTIEAQTTNQVSNDASTGNNHSSGQNVSIEPTEIADTSINSDINEQATLNTEEGSVDPNVSQSNSQRILFAAFEEGADQLFSIKPNGEDLQKITNFDEGYVMSVSPDLSHIAFTTNGLIRGYAYDVIGSIGNSGIYIAPISDINNLSLEPVRGSKDILALGNFVWSPDSSQFAMFGTRSGDIELYENGLYDTGLYVIDIEADEINFLVEEEEDVEYTTVWSPDGDKLAFVSEEGEGNRIFILNSDGSGLVNILDDPNSQFRELVWSHDATKITFNQRINNLDYTRIIDIRSGLVSDLPDGTIADNLGVTSPDGTKIATVERINNEPSDIFVVNADGTGRQQFTNYEPNTGWDQCPVWSPDSTQLVFMSLADGNIAELIVSDGVSRVILIRSSENMSIRCPIGWTP